MEIPLTRQDLIEVVGAAMGEVHAEIKSMRKDVDDVLSNIEHLAQTVKQGFELSNEKTDHVEEQLMQVNEGLQKEISHVKSALIVRLDSLERNLSHTDEKTNEMKKELDMVTEFTLAEHKRAA